MSDRKFIRIHQSFMVGNSISVVIENGRLAIETWRGFSSVNLTGQDIKIFIKVT